MMASILFALCILISQHCCAAFQLQMNNIQHSTKRGRTLESMQLKLLSEKGNRETVLKGSESVQGGTKTIGNESTKQMKKAKQKVQTKRIRKDTVQVVNENATQTDSVDAFVEQIPAVKKLPQRKGKTAISSKDDTDTNEKSKQVNMKKAQTMTSRKDDVESVPPHTALSKVFANQFGIDITSVCPLSMEPGARITSEDVKYHAWTLSQPPCTSEALKLAYSIGLDLNGLYDDDTRTYVMSKNEVQLYIENSRSLKMSSQVVKKETRRQQLSKKRKKMNALDKRVEQNVVKLADRTLRLATSLTGEIVNQVHLQMQNIQRNTDNERSKRDGVIVNINMLSHDKSANDIQSIEDFDVDLANEIQDALDTAGESLPLVVALVPSPPPLQSLTTAQLKELLRQRGLKLSGVKAELLERLLLDCKDDSADVIRDSGNVDEISVPFFLRQ
jgi:hypothetical protein